ncbi:hypothetical protein R0137_03675 [Congregibacter brevis]|uniref:DUF4345 domain-containing protein n=1 Tax=Congregibacter brevis TaxID=3081201 RepID=A0ABZ0IFQ9_9GAMM|nr:hypothetical protein R0137_03675 [Congregibacter sp. IMCC45268]
MNPQLKFALLIYITNIVVLLVIGLLFEFRPEFFPFHSDVIETSWKDVELKYQILYLGMMRTEGAGYLATATALTILLCIPFLRYEKWSYWAMTTIGFVEHFPTLAATYHVSSITAASPPWLLSFLLILSLMFAWFLANSGHRKHTCESQVSSASA